MHNAKNFITNLTHLLGIYCFQLVRPFHKRSNLLMEISRSGVYNVLNFSGKYACIGSIFANLSYFSGSSLLSTKCKNLSIATNRLYDITRFIIHLLNTVVHNIMNVSQLPKLAHVHSEAKMYSNFIWCHMFPLFESGFVLSVKKLTEEIVHYRDWYNWIYAKLFHQWKTN